MGSSVLLYRDDGSTQPHELSSIKFELRPNGVAVVTFDTPGTYHALTPLLREEMFVVLEHAARNPEVKVVLWTASGDKAFCSGASLKGGGELRLPKDVLAEYIRRGLSPNLKSDNAFVRETRAFWDFPKPIVAAINGMAVGGGANIALCNYFDIVLCSSQARFKYPFVDIGFTPELGSSLVLPLTAGLARAKEVIFTGEWFSAEQAKAWSLVNEVYAPEELMPKALELADKLATKPTNQLILSKRLLNSHLRGSLDEVLRRENETILASVHDFGGREAFLNRIKAQAKKGAASKL